MKTNNFEAHEYRTPVCKVVEVHVEGSLLQNSFGDSGKAGSSTDVDYDGEDY